MGTRHLPAYSTVSNRHDRIRSLVDYAMRFNGVGGARNFSLGVNEHSVDAYVDPADRAATLALGAMLYRVRLEMRCHLMDSELEFSPNPSRPDCIARLWVSGAGTHSARDMDEFEAMHAHARPVGLAAPVHPAAVRELCLCAQEEGAVLVHVDLGPPRAVLSELIYAGEQRRRTSKRCRIQAAIDRPEWSPRPTEPNEMVTRWESAPTVLMIMSKADEAKDRLAAGAAWQKVAFVAATHGLGLVYGNAPLAYGDLRERLVERSRLRLQPQQIFQLCRLDG